ncbi:MAG: thiol oxidoreductase [Ferruginibacter sp.]|nr:thiol oxidoreductase [Cytophagales bacterium]
MSKIRPLCTSVFLYGCAVTFIACEVISPAAPDPETILNESVENLTPEQLRNHSQGDEEFGRVFAVADGLGPIFVSNSCESCHVGDGKGHPATTLTRFNRPDGLDFDPMVSVGASQLQQRAIPGYTAEVLPVDVRGSARLTPPAVTGLGYLAAVPDADLLAMADPADADGDGISGVPNYLPPPDFFVPQSFHVRDNLGRYIGRFGKKAGAIDLLQQTANAYLLDIGITSDFLTEDLYNELIGNHTGDNVPDPEVSASVIRNVVFYLRTLKAPPRRNAQHPDVLAGKKTFAETGCNGCHVATLKTGLTDIQAPLYSIGREISPQRTVRVRAHLDEEDPGSCRVCT